MIPFHYHCLFILKTYVAHVHRLSHHPTNNLYFCYAPVVWDSTNRKGECSMIILWICGWDNQNQPWKITKLDEITNFWTNVCKFGWILYNHLYVDLSLQWFVAYAPYFETRNKIAASNNIGALLFITMENFQFNVMWFDSHLPSFEYRPQKTFFKSHLHCPLRPWWWSLKVRYMGFKRSLFVISPLFIGYETCNQA
jgi:hypothetical protein